MATRTLSVPVKTKKILAVIAKGEKAANDRKEKLSTQRSKLLTRSKDYFNIMVGRHYLIKDKARNSTSELFLTVTSVGEPYLIGEDTTITCALRCTEVRITRNVWDGKKYTQISYNENCGYYAHTDMQEVPKARYKGALDAAISLMKKTLEQA